MDVPDSIECHQNKHNNQKTQTATLKIFLKRLHILTIEYQWIQKAL